MVLAEVRSHLYEKVSPQIVTQRINFGISESVELCGNRQHCDFVCLKGPLNNTIRLIMENPIHRYNTPNGGIFGDSILSRWQFEQGIHYLCLYSTLQILYFYSGPFRIDCPPYLYNLCHNSNNSQLLFAYALISQLRLSF